MPSDSPSIIELANLLVRLPDAESSAPNNAREVTPDLRQCSTLVTYSPLLGARKPILATIARISCVSTPQSQRRRDTNEPRRRTNRYGRKFRTLSEWVTHDVAYQAMATVVTKPKASVGRPSRQRYFGSRLQQCPQHPGRLLVNLQPLSQ